MVDFVLKVSGTGDRAMLRKILAFTGASGMSLCMTCLYLAMRGVMDLGGFVARGGPYAIVHPAPGWVWIFPAGLLAGLAFLGLYLVNSGFLGGLNLGFLAWPVLFLSLGENFLEYAFRKSGFNAAWFFCGVLFALMGGLPVWGMIKTVYRERRRRRERAENQNMPGPGKTEKLQVGPLLLSLLAIVLGVFLGARLFLAVSGG